MSNEWEKLNQAYWDAWKALAEAANPAEQGKAGAGTSASANPWADVLQQWWGMAQGMVPGMSAAGAAGLDGGKSQSAAGSPAFPGFALFDQMVDQSRQLFGFAEMLREAFDDRSDAPPVERFAQSLRDAIGSWRMANRAAEFAVPFMQWPLAPPVQGGFNPFAGFAQGPAGGGGTRFQLSDDWDPAAFTRVFNDYHQALNAVAEQQFKALEQAVGSLPELKLPEGPEATAEGMRAFYARWLEACDGALADLSASENYGEQFGALVNAYLRLQQMLWRPADDAASNSDRERLDALEASVAEMADTMKALHAGLGELPLNNMVAHVGVLTDEINELRDALETLEATSASKAGASAAAGQDRPGPAATRRKSAKASPKETSRAGSGGSAPSRPAAKKRSAKVGGTAKAKRVATPPIDPFDIGSIDET